MRNKRRPHRKSRGGCVECKRRHIKCDEEKPSCLHCRRHDVHCIYGHRSTPANHTLLDECSPTHSDLSWQSIGPDEYIHTPHEVHVAPESIAQDHFDMKDMVLLHHWISVASYGIVNTNEMDHYWQTIIPSIGFRYQYVIRSILSLSALHMAYSNPLNRNNYLHDAAEHRSQALRGFTEDLHNVGPENGSALFANAILTFFYAFVSFSKTFEDEDADEKSRSARTLGTEWIPLVHGTGTVLKSVFEYIKDGPLRSFLEIRHFYDCDLKEVFHDDPYLEQLIKIQDICASDIYSHVYIEALQVLRRCWIWMEELQDLNDDARSSWGHNRFYSGPFIWLFEAPEEYFTLQQQRQPLALIIFAYYGVLVHRLNGYWWAENCGRNIISNVDGCLGPYWSSCVDWAKQTVGL